MTRRATETKTIQCWPGGESYEYRGDVDGPANQRSLRAGYYQSRIRCSENCREVRRRYHEGEIPESRLTELDGKYCQWTDNDDWLASAKVCEACQGAGYVPNPKRNPWRKGTADEWRQIRINVRALMYQDRDVLCCDSALVGDLIGLEHEIRGDLAEGFSGEEIRNLYKDPSDWDIETCRDYLQDMSTGSTPDPDPWEMDRAALVEALTDAGIDTRDDETDETLREAVIANIDDETIDGIEDWREACREHTQDNPAEVYEWWRVTSWLCDKLHEIGEVTIDNGYGRWWGRTCTGQQYIMDGTLQKVAAQFERGE